MKEKTKDYKKLKVRKLKQSNGTLNVLYIAEQDSHTRPEMDKERCMAVSHHHSQNQSSPEVGMCNSQRVFFFNSSFNDPLKFIMIKDGNILD